MSNRRQKARPQNTINRQLEQPVAVAREKDDNLIQLGKFFYTLASLTYAGAVLTMLLEFTAEKVIPLILSLFGLLLFALTGWSLIKRGNIK